MATSDIHLFLQRFGKSELHGFYVAYRKYLDQQSLFLETDIAKRMLEIVFTMFPALSELMYFPRPQSLIYPNLIPFESLSQTGQEILAEPLYPVHFEGGSFRFWDLLELAHQSGKAGQLTSIVSHDIGVQWWSCLAARYEHIWNSLTGLQNISFEFLYNEPDWQDPETEYQLRKMLNALTSLKSLRISFPHHSPIPLWRCTS